MVSIDEYKVNPCRVSSIPYWKMRTLKTPNNISVIHEEDYINVQNNLCIDTLYFRLKHNLENVKPFNLDKRFKYRNVDFNCENDLQEVVCIINKSYIDIKVDIKQVEQWTRTEVFDKNLWVFIIDVDNQKPIALGIAELDKDVREGALEWIQVLPEHRNRKLGQAIVSKLLINLLGRADFVTVSGQVDNKTNPEKLYRRCGFQGNDIWHVLVRNQTL
jgi:ribosomal protein S18 acetylase RimI-like enzyme